MARKQKRQPAPLATIAGSTLAHVIGGRMSVKAGTDPELLRGVKTLAETVGQVGQVLQQKQAEKQGMMQQVMQQMMGARGR